MKAQPAWYPTPEGNLRYWDGAQWTRHVAPAPGPRAGGAGRAGRVPVASLVGWGGLCLVAVLGAAGSGVSGGLVLSGTYLLVVAVTALVRGRLRWARLRNRAAGAAALGTAVVLTLVGGAVATPPQTSPTAAPPAPTASHTPTTTPTSTTKATPTPTVTASRAPAPRVTRPTPATAAKGTALAAVATLTVKGRAPRTGYSRERFGQAWFDTNRNGCDTRNDILRRDLVDTDVKNSCKVLAGTRSPDPYTGTTIRFVLGGPSEIDIDHVVPLSDAWQKGAARWAPGRRLAFANDPLNLLAVDAGANRSKGDGDVATWLPPNKAYRCQYVARVVAVKGKYQVWATPAERDAMVRVLSTCAGTPLPGPGPAPTTATLPRPAPTPNPDAPPPAAAPDAPAKVDYANCDAVRAAGADPIHRGDPGWQDKFDRDGDGTGCER